MSLMKMKYPVLIILCIICLTAVAGCGRSNSESSFDPEGESHSTDWLPARHAAAAQRNLDECKQCHGIHFSAKTPCVECHMGSPTDIHPGEWEDRVAVRHNEYVDDNGTARCSNIYCHGEDLDGVAFSGPSCSSCHIGGDDFYHPEEWGDFAYSRHASYVRNNGNSSCSNGSCHGADLAGVDESGTSCTRCHLGGTDSYHPKQWGSDIRSETGLVRNDIWLLDLNNNKSIDFPSDRQFDPVIPDGIPVPGDWNGDGRSELGVYDPDTATWYLDLNGDGRWDGTPTDASAFHGFAGVIPVTGDWNGDGKTEIGVYDPNTAIWYLDFNGNGRWDGTPTDASAFHGFAGVIPVTGDWNGNGKTEIGVYDPNTAKWYLDFNGNGKWDGTTIDHTAWFGFNGAVPITGDWNGDRITDIGIFYDGEWFIDSNGNGTYEIDFDETFTFGISGDVPITGDWNRNAIVNLHGIYVSSRGGDSCANAACHGTDLNGVEESGPSCYICHGPSFPAAGF